MKLSFKKVFKRRKSEKLRLRTIISGAFIVIIVPVVLFSLFRPSNPEAAWMNDAWIYRTTLSFTHNAAVSNTKVKFDIDTATLITAGKMQSDCGDSRFTDVNGKVLEYYIDAGVGACNTSSTDYYVLIPSIVNGSNMIYHYYGNPTVINGTNSAQFSQSTTTPSGGAASTGTETKTNGPVIYYKMDELGNDRCSGLSNDVCDARGTTIDGAISNGTAWKNEDFCLSGGCLFFDGTDDVVTTTQTSAINLSAQLAAGFTFEAWIKPMSAGEGTGGQIFFKGTNTWLRVDTLSSGVLDIEGSVDLATTDATLNVASKVTTSRWTHVAMSYTDDADDEITIWVNGVAVGTSTNGVGSPATDTNNLLIGGTTTNNFKGYIDEFKIYNYERSTAQVATDAIVNGTSKGDAALFGQRSNAMISDGLTGYWPMNESSWATNCSTASVLDYSGNANNGKPCPNASAATLGIGKFGPSGSFDGTNDYIELPSTSLDPSRAFTISAWINPTSLAGSPMIIGTSSGTDLQFGVNPSGQLDFYGGSADAVSTTGSVTTNKWQHVVVSYNGAGKYRFYVNGIDVTSTENGDTLSTITTLTIGRWQTYYFTGKIDEVRFYNKSLSQIEIRQLYGWAPAPVGYWPFDENGGQVAYDLSGNDWWGDLGKSSAVEGEDPTYITGKYGTGVNFTAGDTGFSKVVLVGDDDYVDFDANTGFTVNAWVKIDGQSQFNNDGHIADKINTGTDAGFRLSYAGSPGCNVEYAICFTVQDGTDTYVYSTNTTVTLGTWYYITAVFDRASESNSKIYFNGVEQPLYRNGTFANIGSTASGNYLCIGEKSAGVDCGDLDAIMGSVDDLKIYNYARTPDQIMKDMAGNHALGGFPTGSQVGYWNLDDLNGTTAQDSTANNQDLTLTNSPAWTTSGKVNSGIDFESSSSQYASTADSIALSITGDLSISAWINPESITAATLFPIAGKGGGAVTSYLLAQYGDEIRMYIGSSSNYVTTNATNLATSTWYHITGTYNATSQTVKIFVNGQEQAATTTGTIPSSITDGADSFMVGGFLNTTAASFQVAATADDGLEQANTTWNASPTNGANGFGYYSGVGDIEAGLRFNNVNIAQGTTITGAHLEVYGFSGANIGTISSVHGKIYADKVDNAAAWSSTSRPSQITTTTAAIDWDPTTWPDSWISSPDITTVVQEIISRGGWASGNSLRIGIWNDGVASGQNVVAFHDYDNGTGIPGKLIVNYASGSSSYYDGKIDDVQVFNAALTVDQVGRVMNANSAINFGSTATSESTQITGTAETGPLGYWPLDENTGTTAYDHSGNGNNGTLTASPTWATGKISSGIRLNGSSQYITMGDLSAYDFADGTSVTMEAWIYRSGTDTDQAIVSKKNCANSTCTGYEIYQWSGGNGGNTCLYVGDGTDQIDVCTGDSTTLTLNTWYHIAAVFDDSSLTNSTIYINGVNSKYVPYDAGTIGNINSLSSSNSLMIGAQQTPSAFFNGRIDDVKIYNYARTQAQIAYDYNRGRPIGMWKFDDCQGTTANDSSGNSLTGTWSGSSGSQTSVGTCTTSSTAWGNGASGKFNNSLNFDGTDDKVTITDNSLLDLVTTRNYSLSSWIYPTTIGTGNAIYQAGTSGTNTLTVEALTTSDTEFGPVTNGIGVYWLSGWTTNGLLVHTKNNVISTGAWYFVTATYDASQSVSNRIKIYVNGVDQTETTDVYTVGTIADISPTTTTIGTDLSNEWFAGQIDEVGLYNYALTQSQIKILYNGGSSARFGPLTGTPAP